MKGLSSKRLKLELILNWNFDSKVNKEKPKEKPNNQDNKTQGPMFNAVVDQVTTINMLNVDKVNLGW